MRELEYLIEMLENMKHDLEEELTSDDCMTIEHYNQVIGAYNCLCSIFNKYQKHILDVGTRI